MSKRAGGAGKPLSAKAASLLADLKANAPQRESAYIGNLVETAAKRKRASELAFEKRIAREAEEEGAPTMNFVTKSYEEKIQKAQEATGESVSAESVLLRNAEKIDSSATKSLGTTSSRVSSGNTRRGIDTTELIRRRDARRAARKAPASRLTEEFVEQARQRARQRLGVPNA